MPGYPERTAGASRNALFREPPLKWAKRAGLGLVRALQPGRISQVPLNIWLWVVALVEPGAGLPDPEAAPMAFQGVCGIARDLSVVTLLRAHCRGLYPSAHVGPIKWWSPPEHCVLFFDEFHIASRLKRQMRQGRHTVTFDRDFDAVIVACAEPRDGKWPVTWITPKIMHAYADMHDAGFAHSFEVWNEAGELVGGGFGVAAGGVFIIESQFSRETNTSKMGCTSLAYHLVAVGLRHGQRQGTDADHPRHGVPLHFAGGLPRPPRGGRPDAGQARPLGGRSRPQDGRSLGSEGSRSQNSDGRLIRSVGRRVEFRPTAADRASSLRGAKRRSNPVATKKETGLLRCARNDGQRNIEDRRRDQRVSSRPMASRIALVPQEPPSSHGRRSPLA